MTEKANKLLNELVSKYNETGKRHFPGSVCLGYSDDVVDELEYNYYISKENDVIGSIVLTDKAINN